MNPESKYIIVIVDLPFFHTVTFLYIFFDVDNQATVKSFVCPRAYLQVQYLLVAIKSDISLMVKKFIEGLRGESQDLPRLARAQTQVIGSGCLSFAYLFLEPFPLQKVMGCCLFLIPFFVYRFAYRTAFTLRIQ